MRLAPAVALVHSFFVYSPTLLLNWSVSCWSVILKGILVGRSVWMLIGDMDWADVGVCRYGGCCLFLVIFDGVPC